MRRLAEIIVLAIISAVPASAQIANANVAPPMRSSSSNSAVEEIPSRSVIRGRVAYADTNKPIRRTEIVLLSPELNAELYQATTDDEGRFVVRNVRRGKYYFKINSPGVLNPNRRVAAKLGDTYELDFAKLDAEFDHVEVDGMSEAQAFVRVRRAGVIAGRITYEDGDPAPGVTVVVLRKGAGFLQYDRSDGLNVETDDRGQYRIWGLADGEYVVMVNELSRRTSQDSGASGFLGELKTYYPGTNDLDKAKPVKVEQGVEQNEINVTITSRSVFRVSGKITDKVTGKPIANATVSIKSLDEPELTVIDYTANEPLPSISDDSGEFAIDDLPAGKYQILVTAQNRFELPKPGVPDKIKYFGRVRKEFEVIEKDVAINIEVPPQSVISGKILVEEKQPPPSSVFIYLLEDGRVKDEAARTYVSRSYFESGIADFELQNLYEGEFELIPWLPEGYFVITARRGTTDLLEGPLKLKEGETIDDVEIVISNAVGSISGRVTDYDSSRQSARILLVPITSRQNLVLIRSQSIAVKGDGTFLGSAAPGDYYAIVLDTRDLGATDLRQTDDEDWPTYYSRVTKGGTKVTITVGQTTKIELIAPRR